MTEQQARTGTRSRGIAGDVGLIDGAPVMVGRKPRRAPVPSGTKVQRPACADGSGGGSAAGGGAAGVAPSGVALHSAGRGVGSGGGRGVGRGTAGEASGAGSRARGAGNVARATDGSATHTMRTRLDSPPVPASRTAAQCAGSVGEDVALEFLLARGYQLLDRNWTSRFGELDIVLQTPEGMIVFVEVKYRSTGWGGGGLAAVTPGKLRKLRLAGSLWLREHPARSERPVRFDVVDVGPDGVRAHVEGVQ